MCKRAEVVDYLKCLEEDFIVNMVFDGKSVELISNGVMESVLVKFVCEMVLLRLVQSSQQSKTGCISLWK